MGKRLCGPRIKRYGRMTHHLAPIGGRKVRCPMLQVVSDGIVDARKAGVEELFNDYSKRSIGAIAKGIGLTESEALEFLSVHFPHAVRSTGPRTGKVYFSLS